MQFVDPLSPAENPSAPCDGEGGPARERAEALAEEVSGPFKIRTLIADDEPIAREVLTRMLKKEGDIEIVGTATNGREAADAIQRLSPDLAFLDMQMPEMNGLDVLARLGAARPPAVVFLTASQGYALQAFEAHALDYLLKPCSRARFKAAVQRARECIQTSREARARRENASQLDGYCDDARQPKRLAVRSAGKILFLSPRDIRWVEALEGEVNLHLGGDSCRIEGDLAALGAKLGPEQFLQISESALVNLDHVDHLAPTTESQYAVRMRDGHTLTLTPAYRVNLSRLCWL